MYDVFVDLLKKKGVRAYDVSKETGISSSVFTDWKKGRYTPKADKLQKIADYFGVSLEYMMTGSEASSMDLSKDEVDIILDYRKLNSNGKSMLLAQLRMISNDELYTKDTAQAAG